MKSPVQIPWNASRSLRLLQASDPWMAIGIMQVLDKEQWQLLLSGKAFEKVRDFGKRLAERRLRTKCHELTEAVMNEVFALLATRDFLKAYKPTKGPPRPYMQGVINRFTGAVVRLRANQLLNPLPDHAEVAIESVEPNPESFLIRQDLFQTVKKVVSGLEPKYRDAMRRRHPVLGKPRTPFDGNAAAELTRYTRAKDMVRDALRNMDEMP